jgi:hypothetical protein
MRIMGLVMVCHGALRDDWLLSLCRIASEEAGVKKIPSSLRRDVVLLVRHVLHPGDVGSVQRFLHGEMDHASAGRGPLPVPFTRRDPDSVSRSNLSNGSAPGLARLTPERTCRVCPNGWVCQAVRAPGSKLTRAARARAGAGASMIGSCPTVPVNASAGARLVSIVPAARISMLISLYSCSIASSARPKGVAPEYAQPHTKRLCKERAPFAKH